MVITFKTGARGRVSVYGDGELIAAVDEDFAFSCGYKDNDDIDGAQLTAFVEAVRLRSAFLGGMRLIALRDHGKKELENKLCQKGHKRVYAAAAAEMLEERGLIDDESYAISLAKRLYEEKGFSARRIKSELYLKGISGETASIAVENIDIDPISRIIELLNSKYSANLTTEKGIKKTFSALQRMGYGYSDIRSAFSQLEISTEPED